MPRVPRGFIKVFDVIRLQRHGCANRPFFHIVLLKNTQARLEPPIEKLGTFDPMTNVHNEVLVSLDVERIKYHLSRDAEISTPVAHILGLAGILPVSPRTYLLARRNQQKQEALKEEQNESTDNDQKEEKG